MAQLVEGLVASRRGTPSHCSIGGCQKLIVFAPVVELVQLLYAESGKEVYCLLCKLSTQRHCVTLFCLCNPDHKPQPYANCLGPFPLLRRVCLVLSKLLKSSYEYGFKLRSNSETISIISCPRVEVELYRKRDSIAQAVSMP